MNRLIPTFQEMGMRVKRQTLPRDVQTVSRKASKLIAFLAVVFGMVKTEGCDSTRKSYTGGVGRTRLQF